MTTTPPVRVTGRPPVPLKDQPDSYFIAARDAEQNIRLGRGRGLLVAKNTHGRKVIEGFLRQTDNPVFIRAYRAAIDLIDRENGPDTLYTVEEMARVAHEANRELQRINGSTGIPISPPWDQLDEHTKASIMSGVEGALAGLTPAQSHAEWARFKEADGWVYGETKDSLNKTHPNLVPFEKLTAHERVKDTLFTSIVRALR